MLPSPENSNFQSKQPLIGDVFEAGPLFRGVNPLYQAMSNSESGPYRLAVEQSIHDVFDDMSDVVAGELKRMTMEDAFPEKA